MAAAILRKAAALAFAVSLALVASPALADGAGDPSAPAGVSGVPQGDEELEAFEIESDPLFDDDFEAEDAAGQVYDPFEGGNRAIFGFNRKVDHYVLDPITKGYRFAVPGVARRSVHRVFTNLNTPVYVMNHLLQVRFRAAAETLGAFLLNSTFGLGGILEVDAGLELQPADFGQTLALAGVGSGPYLMIPVLGPSTVRDGLGWAVDRLFHPLTYFLGIPTQLIWGGGWGVSYREATADKLEALEESSVDFYAVMRSAYSQARTQSIEDARASDEEIEIAVAEEEPTPVEPAEVVEEQPELPAHGPLIPPVTEAPQLAEERMLPSVSRPSAIASAH